MKKIFYSPTGRSASGGKPSAFCLLPSAFTLIELLVVMVVITIMAGITIPISRYVTTRSRLANQRIDLEKIRSALEDYRAAYGEYPITPTNEGAARHYFYIDYNTKGCEDYFNPSNSSFTNIDLTVTNVEWMQTDKGYLRGIDYSLTYPLMLRQRADGARPFMEFKDATVAFLVYKAPGAGDIFQVTRRRRLGGSVDEVTKQGVYAKPVNRPKAVDPVSQKQWKYTSVDGVTYTLTVHTNESGF